MKIYLKQTDHGWFERGTQPPWLAKQTVLTDLTGLAEVTLPAPTDGAYLNAVRYNMMIRDKESENTARDELGLGQRRHYAMVFASVLAASLRPNTELLLKELQSTCRLVGITGQHDGYAMLKAMRLKAALPSAIQNISSLMGCA